MRQSFLIALAFILISPTRNQQVLTNIPFECQGRGDGHWRDSRYCDVFHACIDGEQKISYGCPQVGDRFYYDDNTRRCEFASNNTGGCPANQYYTPVTNATTVPSSQLTTSAPSEQWKIFVLSQEQFSCASRQDGFYASRWCNVFYRCFSGVSNIFLCPLQRGGGRLWWIQHGTSQGLPEGPTAVCAFPCETGRPCSSAGGILVENGNQISESQQAAETAYRQSSCSNQTGTGQTGTGQTGVGQTGTSQIGTRQTVTSQTGTGQTGVGQTGTGQTGGSFTVNSNVNCDGQASDVYLSSPYCNIFHRCVSGSRFDIRCPRANNLTYDLWWNQQTNLCDWPCRVQCSNQLFQSSMSTQQVASHSLAFFNNDCRAYPPIPTFN